jgi:hypothetical protein
MTYSNIPQFRSIYQGRSSSCAHNHLTAAQSEGCIGRGLGAAAARNGFGIRGGVGCVLTAAVTGVGLPSREDSGTMKTFKVAKD